MMRRVLIDHARARQRVKRGGGVRAVAGEPVRISLANEFEAPAAPADDATMLLALEDALTRLEQQNPRLCRVVECRCFAGMSVEETAEALQTSVATVKRDWAFARAWLNHELTDGEPQR
jgi:RNA polymerase sigma factor (TIGR02999 family)